MAIARLKDGTTVDLAGAEIMPGDHEVLAVLLCAGDTNDNGKADLTIAPGVRLPPFPPVGLPPLTRDIPVEQVVGVLANATGAIAGALPAGVLGAGEALRVIRTLKAVTGR